MSTLTIGYPPADALYQQLLKIEYKKHLQTLTTIVLTVAAFVYVLGQKAGEWYYNGGKETLQNYVQKTAKLLVLGYSWCRDYATPALIKFAQNVKQTYAAWKGLVTVG